MRTPPTGPFADTLMATRTRSLQTIVGNLDAADAILEVSQLSQYLTLLLDGDPVLSDVWLRGEVCNLTRSASGHYYFGLKDDASQLRAILFRSSAQRATVLPEPGMAVVVHGRVRFYERQGTCEVVADLVFPEGLGLAQMQFEALFRRLEAEGLFDEARKRPIPTFPRRIGIISSPAGAAIHDLVTVLGRRYPLGDVVFVPAAVQGDDAARSLVAALQALGDWTARVDGRGVDVIVLARGGGSAEDLAAFNDASLVRAIFASRAPVVSAVGHETDVTLADLVADLRAPTPSAAAELITPDLAAVMRDVAALRSRARSVVRSTVVRAAERCEAARRDLAGTLATTLREARQDVERCRLRLTVLSPAGTLERGYALAEREDGRVVRDAAELRPGDTVQLRLHRGRADTTVRAVQPVRA